MGLGWTVCVEVSRDKPDVCEETISSSGSCGAAVVGDVGVENCANVSDLG